MNNNQITIKVIGSGCPTCKKLYELTKQAAAELNLDAEVEYSTDIQELLAMGVMQSPVLAVNGKPVMNGATNDVEEIKNLLIEASQPIANDSGSGCGCGCGCGA